MECTVASSQELSSKPDSLHPCWLTSEQRHDELVKRPLLKEPRMPPFILSPIWHLSPTTFGLGGMMYLVTVSKPWLSRPICFPSTKTRNVWSHVTFAVMFFGDEPSREENHRCMRLLSIKKKTQMVRNKSGFRKVALLLLPSKSNLEIEFYGGRKNLWARAGKLPSSNTGDNQQSSSTLIQTESNRAWTQGILVREAKAPSLRQLAFNKRRLQITAHHWRI